MIFKFITDCKELGCTQLDPWNAHLATIRQGDAVLHAGDELIATGPDEGHPLLAELGGYVLIEDEETGEEELVPAATASRDV